MTSTFYDIEINESYYISNITRLNFYVTLVLNKDPLIYIYYFRIIVL